MTPGRRLAALLRTHRTRFFFAAGTALVSSLSLLAFPLFVRDLFGASAAPSFGTLAGRLALLAGVLIASSYSAYAAMFRVSREVTRDLRTAVCDHLLRLPMAFHRERASGDILDRFTRSIADVDWFLRYTLLTVILVSFLSLGAFALLLTLSWKLTLILAAALGILFLFLRPLIARARVAGEEEERQLGGLTARLQELLSGVDLVKAFRAESRESARFAEAARRASSAGGLFVFVEPLIFGLIIVLMLLLLVAAQKLIAAGELDLPTFFAFLMTTLLLMPQARVASLALVRWEQCRNAFRRIDEILALEPEPLTADHAAHDRPRGIIEFRSVSAAYHARHAVEDLTLRIEEHGSIGIVGESGAGKSTIFHLLLRFTDYKGSILLDGAELSAMPLDRARSAFAVVPQDPFLFRATILENIRYGRPEATLDEVAAAVRAAQAAEFIGRLPSGYDTIVGERGATLSGGERQRIAIARALLVDAPCLLLDEATSSLDSATELDLRRALDEAMRRRTVLVIAHRLATVMHLPRLIVLRGGRLVDQGTHEELMSRSAYYRTLVARQFTAEDAPGRAGKDQAA